MRQFNKLPSEEQDASKGTISVLLKLVQTLSQAHGQTDERFAGFSELSLLGHDESGTEIPISLVNYDHSLSTPDTFSEQGLICDIGTTRNVTPKGDGHHIQFELHDYKVIDLNGELVIRKNIETGASDDMDNFFDKWRDALSEGRVIYLPTASPEVKAQVEAQIDKQKEESQAANDLYVQTGLNIPSEQEVSGLITLIQEAEIEHPKKLERLSDEELGNLVRKRLSKD